MHSSLADSPDRPSLLRRLFWAVVLVVPTPLLIALFMHAAMPIPRMLTTLGAFAAAIITLALWQRDATLRRPRNLALAVLLGSALIVGVAIVWNTAYLAFAEMVPRQEIFRRALFRYSTPAYGLPDQPPLGRAWPAIVLSLLAAAWVLWAKLDKGRPALRLAVIAMVMAASVFVFARTEPPEGRERNVALNAKARKAAKAAGQPKPAVDSRRDGFAFGFRNFREDATKFDSPGDLLRTYVAKMPTLSWFGRHYPPGSAMLFWFDAKGQKAWQKLTGKPRATLPIAMAVIAVTCALAVVPVYAATRELAPDSPRAALFAALAYAAAASPIIFASLSTTPLILLPAAGAIWAALRAARTGGVLPAIVLGVCLPAFALVSFSAVYFAVALGASFALCYAFRLFPRKHLWKTAGVSLSVSLLCVGALRVAGFDLIACARIGLEQHHTQASTGGFDAAGLYFMRLTGNTLAFALMNLPLLGIALASAMLWRKADWREPRRVLLPAVVFGIAAAAFSGSFFLETERIWVFFVPFLAVVAGLELAHGEDTAEARLAVVMMIAFAVTQELSYIHYIG